MWKKLPLRSGNGIRPFGGSLEFRRELHPSKKKGKDMSTVAVVGLGYVGLPLATAFGKKFRTIGFDLSAEKVANYRRYLDPTGEVSSEELRAAAQLTVTSDPTQLASADLIVVAVPTPVDNVRQPDFGPLVGASTTVGAHMKKGATVVYESTVYPGATEEVCIPVLEKHSGKTWLKDFNVGYSPERINPGDKEHRLETIVKVVAGDTPETLERVAQLYGAVVGAGVYRASSIKVAEAAKVIENTQRDLNIALINELAIIFNRIGIDTLEVLQAAGTKWNFLPFRPGLVGGHCIGVDPYYLTYKAEMLGYHPEVILAGRRINDNMGKFIAEQTIKQMIRSGSPVKGAKINVLGLTFKENVPDLRNSHVIDVINELKTYGVEVLVHDPVPSSEEAHHEYGLELVPWEKLPAADAMVAAVAHRQFKEMGVEKLALKVKKGGCFIDVKCQFDRKALVAAGLSVWRL
jgi:UDP-N-acetyl-D-glucosamine/UDP-N-acetyl-D-galactosamine dehydrogenase